MNSNLLSVIRSLTPDELLELKDTIIDDVDKMRYAKEVLSSLSLEETKKTIEWLSQKMV